MLGSRMPAVLAAGFSLFAVLLVGLLIVFYGVLVFGIVQYYTRRRRHPDDW